MNTKGQRTFNNENVHRIKMLRNLRGGWTSFIIAEKLLTARPLPKAPPQVRQGCVPFGESKNGFLILDLPDFAVERNVKSETGFVTLVTFRQRVLYATASGNVSSMREPLDGSLWWYWIAANAAKKNGASFKNYHRRPSVLSLWSADKTKSFL